MNNIIDCGFFDFKHDRIINFTILIRNLGLFQNKPSEKTKRRLDIPWMDMLDKRVRLLAKLCLEFQLANMKLVPVLVF